MCVVVVSVGEGVVADNQTMSWGVIPHSFSRRNLILFPDPIPMKFGSSYNHKHTKKQL